MAPLVAALARRFDARLTLLHVCGTPAGVSDFTPIERHFGTILEELRGQLNRYQQAVFAGIPTDRNFKFGDVVTEITDLAQTAQVDLIVMPTHGRTRFRELLLGSVTSGVLHDAETPVLTSAHTAETPVFQGLPTSIVCAVDLTPASIGVLAAASRFAATVGASLRVIHALPDFGIAGGFANIEWEVQAERCRRDYRPIADAAGTSAPLEILAAESVNTAILQAVAVRKAGLLVIGRGKTQGVLGRLRTGAHELIRCSPCPVLSV
jgi:nucleotide-binding universal stress UspA family protein